MEYIGKSHKIALEWAIYRGTSTVKEDFRRAELRLFLLGPNDSYVLSINSADNGVIKATIPEGLPEGVYGLKAIWGKDVHNPFEEKCMPRRIDVNACKLALSMKDDVFGITALAAEAESEDSTVTLKLTTRVATYGYDGLSAYEIAVMRGMTSLSETEWIQVRTGQITSLNIAANAITTDKIADGAVTGDKIASYAVTSSKIADGALTTDKFADGVIDLFITNETERLEALEQRVEELAKIVKKHHPDEPIGDFYYEYGVPVVNLQYQNTTMSASGGTNKVKTLTYTQTCVKKYYNGKPSEQMPDIKSGGVVEYSIAYGSGITLFNNETGEFYLSPNTEFTGRNLSIRVSVALNGRSGTASVSISQMAAERAIVSSVFGTPEVSLSYGTASYQGETLTPVYSYRQRRDDTYNDGTTATIYLRDGGQLEWTNVTYQSTGKVVVPSTAETSDHDVVTVTLSVSMNGKFGSASHTIRQYGTHSDPTPAPVTKKNYYVGELNSSRADFSSMTTGELVNNATNYQSDSGSSTGDKTVSATHTVFYVIAPTNATLTKFQYTSDGSVSDILGNDAFNTTHANVTISGIEYKVYAYRQATTTSTDPLTWTYSIQF